MTAGSFGIFPITCQGAIETGEGAQGCTPGALVGYWMNKRVPSLNVLKYTETGSYCLTQAGLNW